jgi:hypothetical protein
MGDRPSRLGAEVKPDFQEDKPLFLILSELLQAGG